MFVAWNLVTLCFSDPIAPSTAEQLESAAVEVFAVQRCLLCCKLKFVFFQ